ncbi:GlcG/HbpS family heme-binding protein [Glacieibacterium sp.]|uniref:GlcG/HbpS family heme-binding protein n=1 Tax=Glacieibacterium sp. TaxID=2860237 RepID=UPI003AFF9A20
MKHAGLITLALGLLATSAMAQTPPPPPGPPAAPPPPVTGPAGIGAAKALTPDMEVPLEQAIDAARTALEACRAINSAAVVGVVDLNGNFKVLLRADGVGLPFYEFMRRKAYTVLKKGMASGDFGALPQNVGLPRTAVIEGDPGLIVFPGAVPIKRGQTTIGVLSVSGPTGGANDMKCTTAGMAKFHL